MASFVDWRECVNLYMKYFLLLLFFIFSVVCHAQFIDCKVLDADTKQPLYYATIYYNHQKLITFSDSAGNFFFQKDFLKDNDSTKIEFIGYQTSCFSNNEIAENKIFYLHKKTNALQDLVVKNCKEYEEKEIDYNYVKMDSYWTCSPIFNGEFISHFQNQNNITGYITAIKLQTPPFVLSSQNFSIPLLLHWYEWDSIKKVPGKELTDTNILIFAYKHGKNKIEIPDKKIYFDSNGIVIGLQFVYPSELEKKFLQLNTHDEIQKFRDKNVWSFGVVENADDYSIFKVKIKGDIYFNPLKRNNKNLKPALNFTVKTCK